MVQQNLPCSRAMLSSRLRRHFEIDNMFSNLYNLQRSADRPTQKWAPQCTECEGLRKEAFRFLGVLSDFGAA
ncbi:hypothetical protein ASE28_17665 [Acidovorax sp. Root219]|nr:hypothetical protein ASE28_17665 [Acidovorax sp. Root219]